MLPLAATDADILERVRAWATALANEDYESAIAMTQHDPYYGWSPELLRRVVEGYGLPEPHRSGVRFHVTPLDTARGGPTPRHEVVRFPEESPEGIVGDVWFDLPLNGEWSVLAGITDRAGDAFPGHVQGGGVIDDAGTSVAADGVPSAT